MLHYHNGRFVEKIEISPLDEGFLYGNGIFRTMRVEEGTPTLLDEHLKRLSIEGEQLGISVAFERGSLLKLIEKNHAERGLYRLRMIATASGQRIMTLTPYVEMQGPVKLLDYPEPILSPIAQSKTLAHLPRMMVVRWAEQRGAHDAIVRAPDGVILETGCSNLLWRLEGRWQTPKRSLPLYWGVMLEKLSKEREIEEVAVKEIPEGAELFVCNALQQLRQAKGPYLSAASASASILLP